MSTKNNRSLRLNQIIQNTSSLLQCDVITLACRYYINKVYAHVI